MDTALPQKFPFILDRNLAKANCTGNRVCTSCDTVVLGPPTNYRMQTQGTVLRTFSNTVQEKNFSNTAQKKWTLIII